MANVITPTYSFTLPEVGADTNAWGGHLNGNFQTIDTQMLSRTLATAQTMAGALNLPANGLNVGSGQLQVSGGNVSMSGGLTVTGQVTASAAPSAGSSLANKTYVDAQVALKLNLSGGTMTGLLTLSGAPTVALHAATKAYADGIQTTVDGRTVTGSGGLTGGGAISTNPSLSIAAGGVGATQLATDAVTTAKILNANVTPAKLSQPYTSDTAKSASGTGVNFTGVQSWAKRVTVLFDSVAFSSPDTLRLQIGPSGGVETTAYTSTCVAANGGTVNTGTTGFLILSSPSAVAVSGAITLSLVGSNMWVASGNIGGTALNNVIVCTGRKTLAGALSQLTVNGVSGVPFLSGSINIHYE